MRRRPLDHGGVPPAADHSRHGPHLAAALHRAGTGRLVQRPTARRPRRISDADVERVIVTTLEETPKNATHWSTRSMAAATGVSQPTVSRIWRSFAVAPHRSQTFKLSTDPLFIDKVRDVVGLYLDPPEKALILCVDEKSQIQALDRSQPVLPMIPGTPERRSHDYVRAGTTTSSPPSKSPPERSSAHSIAATGWTPGSPADRLCRCRRPQAGANCSATIDATADASRVSSTSMRRMPRRRPV